MSIEPIQYWLVASKYYIKDYNSIMIKRDKKVTHCQSSRVIIIRLGRDCQVLWFSSPGSQRPFYQVSMEFFRLKRDESLYLIRYFVCTIKQMFSAGKWQFQRWNDTETPLLLLLISTLYPFHLGEETLIPDSMPVRFKFQLKTKF